MKIFARFLFIFLITSLLLPLALAYAPPRGFAVKVPKELVGMWKSKKNPNHMVVFREHGTFKWTYTEWTKYTAQSIANPDSPGDSCLFVRGGTIRHLVKTDAHGYMIIGGPWRTLSDKSKPLAPTSAHTCRMIEKNNIAEEALTEPDDLSSFNLRLENDTLMWGSSQYTKMRVGLFHWLWKLS